MCDASCKRTLADAAGTGEVSGAVRVDIQWLDIPTTPMPPDSPYPSFGWDGWRSIYPYSTKNDVSEAPVPARHRAVVLENRYVRATVLPDLGGRLFSLYDKIAGQETFMVPPTLKYQNVASRGAWLAGGIEFNFGRRGHTVFTVDPVTWAIRRGDDGSASVWVGCAVLPVESRWALRISLAPDRAALDLDIHAMGPPALPGMMYWWTNAGVEVTRQSRFFYFGLTADAGHSRHAWPFCDGLDFRWYQSRFVEADMFLMEPQRDYLGFYDFGRHHGLAQTADRFMAPGQKYFTWGTHHQGQFWDRMFSDTDQTYCEIQRGRFGTQGTVDPIPAMAWDGWRESWAPIRDTEGFSAMESDLVLSVVPAGDDAADVRLLGVTVQAGLHLTIGSGDDVLGTWDIARVAPDEAFAQRVALKAGQACDRVRVTDEDGHVLMDWEEFHFPDADWFAEGRHHRRFDPTDSGTDDELFARVERMRHGTWPTPNRYLTALEDKLLARDPGHAGLLRALGEQDLHAGLNTRAAERLEKALERRPRDGDILCLLSWAHLRQGQLDRAVERFSEASAALPLRANALTGLVCARLAAGQIAQALAASDRLAEAFGADPWGRLVRVMALRRAGRTAEAVEAIEGLLAQDPLWSRLHAEAMLLGVETDLGGGRTVGDDSVTAAMPYIELGLWDDATAILSADESNDRVSPAVRLAHLACVRRRAGDAAGEAEAIEAMREAPMELAHPSSAVSIAVLTELARALPDEPALHLMLGNVLGSRSRREEAEAAWQRAVDLGMEHTVPLRNLAMVAADRDDHDRAVGLYRRAWAVSGRNLYLFAEIDHYFAERGLHPERLELYDDLPDEARCRSLVAMRRVLQLLDTGRYDDAIEEFAARTFLRGEFERGIRYYYVEALIGQAGPHIAAGEWDRAREILAKGLDYPRNINMGRHGTRPNESPIHYLLGVVAEMSGDTEAAKEHFQAAAAELHVEGTPASGYEMFAWLALGHRARGMELAHRIEQMARGEIEAPLWFRWRYDPSILEFVHGLAQLAKGRIDEARRMWRDALAKTPDGRWLLLHLNLPEAVLKRMSQAPPYPEQ